MVESDGQTGAAPPSDETDYVAPRVCVLVAEGPTAAFFSQRRRITEHLTPMAFAATSSTKAKVALIAIYNDVTHIAVVTDNVRIDPVHRRFDLVGLQELEQPLSFDLLASAVRQRQPRQLGPDGG